MDARLNIYMNPTQLKTDSFYREKWVISGVVLLFKHTKSPANMTKIYVNLEDCYLIQGKRQFQDKINGDG